MSSRSRRDLIVEAGLKDAAAVLLPLPEVSAAKVITPELTAAIVITRTATIKPLNLARKLFMWPAVRPVVVSFVFEGLAILDTQNTPFRSLI